MQSIIHKISIVNQRKNINNVTLSTLNNFLVNRYLFY